MKKLLALIQIEFKIVQLFPNNRKFRRVVVR